MNKRYQIEPEKSISIKLNPSHPLIILKSIVPWDKIKILVKESLSKSNRGLSRNLDHHIRTLILFIYFNCKYRELVEHLNSNIYARNFCDMGEDDAPYDHTAYLKFVNELPLPIYEEINFIVIMKGKEIGLTKIENIDIDSTVKEANITYPTDAKNLKTQMLMIWDCLKYFKNNGCNNEVAFSLKFNIGKALSDFRKYFFESDKDKKMAILKALTKRIKILTENALAAFEKINLQKIKWYILRKLGKIQKYAKIYIKQVEHFCRTGHACKDKILSFHLENVIPVQKGKEHKKYEFGEVWQVGRIDGNFCFGMFSDTDLRYNDSTAIKDILEKVIIKTNNIPDTLTADRGYWSDDNLDAADSVGISEQGIHPKGNKPWKVTDPDLIAKFINRRAGIEPIIGHLKQLGLGKSKMKTDIGTRVEGAKSFIAFNIRKILHSFE